jgi:hypothetical protein
MTTVGGGATVVSSSQKSARFFLIHFVQFGMPNEGKIMFFHTISKKKLKIRVFLYISGPKITLANFI